MKKPNWKNAPSWARWLAFDPQDHAWYWFQFEPFPASIEWRSDSGLYQKAQQPKETINWRKTLEERPK